MVSVLVSTGVAQVKVPSPSERKNCVAVPVPVTFSSLAPITSAATVAVMFASALLPLMVAQMQQ